MFYAMNKTIVKNICFSFRLISIAIVVYPLNSTLLNEDVSRVDNFCQSVAFAPQCSFGACARNIAKG